MKKKEKESEGTVPIRIYNQNEFPDVICLNCDKYGHFTNVYDKVDKRNQDTTNLLNHNVDTEDSEDSDGLDFTFLMLGENGPS